MSLSISISIAIDSVVRGGGPTPPPANAIISEIGDLIITEDSIIIITE